MSDTSTDAVKALMDGVTQGPWFLEEYSNGFDVIYVRVVAANGVWICDNKPYYPMPVKPANASFIAAARDLVPALLAEKDDLRAKLAKAEAEAEKYKHAFSAQSRKLQAVLHIEGVKATLAKIKGANHE